MWLVFVWAWWSGVRALVQLLYTLHIQDLICVDESDSVAMQQFKNNWIETYIGHDSYTLKPNDVVIYSAATKNSPQVRDAESAMQKDHLAPVPFLYAEFLWEISKYLYTVAITGTHGKSTTTGLTATTAAVLFPDTALAIVWAWVTQRWGNNFWHNTNHTELLQNIIARITSRKATDVEIPLKKYLFIVEADEFNYHFLNLDPDVSIITSMDHDHVDIYPTRESYLRAFKQFCNNTRDCVYTLPRIHNELKECTNIISIQPEQFHFATMIGWHNHSNTSLGLHALNFIAQQTNTQVNYSTIKSSLEQFAWLRRRAELLWVNKNSIKVYTDYGHHPDEIESTIKAFKETFPNQEIHCFIEPHQARRLLSFRKGFATLKQRWTVTMLPIYAAREEINDCITFLQEHPELVHNPKTITSFETLLATFAQQAGVSFITDRDELIQTIEQITSGIIICFTAWKADDYIRTHYKKNS